MATLEIAFLNSQLEERKRRRGTAIALAPRNAGLAGLLREVGWPSRSEGRDRPNHRLGRRIRE